MTEPTPDDHDPHGPDSCGVCGYPEPPHVTMNHEFSLSGILVPKDPNPPPTPKPKVVIVPDVVLRQVLLYKGVITAQDIVDMEAIINGQSPGNPVPDNPQPPDPGGNKPSGPPTQTS